MGVDLRDPLLAIPLGTQLLWQGKFNLMMILLGRQT